MTEAIDQSVPSVLSSAATLLVNTSPADEDEIAIIAPVTNIPSASGLGSPVGVGSRSPSPTGLRLNLPLPQPGSPSTNASHRLSMGALGSVPGLPLPSSGPGSVGSQSPQLLAESLPVMPLDPSPSPRSNRLSFISYTDLLASTPVTATPLSTLTSPPTSDPPPHLPAVSGQVQMQAAHRDPHWGTGHASLKDDTGGEWEREGLGKGLEERIEAYDLSISSKA